MRRSRKVHPLMGLVVALIVVGIVGLLVYNWQRNPVDPSSSEVIPFTIERGQSLDSIGQELVRAGLVRSVAAFKFQVFLSGLTKNIQAGDFLLSADQNLVELINSLTRARTDRRVTLLEGWRREEIALSIERELSTSNPSFQFDSSNFVDKTATLEGKLFPDTYSFPKNMTADQAIEILTQTYKLRTANLTNRSGLTDREALVLASIVERESAEKEERPIVAGILLNRYEIGMALQADATVQYVKATRTCRQLDCNWWPRPLSRADIAVDSPYNTYQYPGLPPAPIANPSLQSIQAAFQPVSTPYWYYLHDPQGQIHYARTLEEHNQNIDRYLR